MQPSVNGWARIEMRKPAFSASSEPGDLYPRSEEPQMSATPCAARYRTRIVHVTSKATLGVCMQFKSLSVRDSPAASVRSIPLIKKGWVRITSIPNLWASTNRSTCVPCPVNSGTEISRRGIRRLHFAQAVYWRVGFYRDQLYGAQSILTTYSSSAVLPTIPFRYPVNTLSSVIII